MKEDGFIRQAMVITCVSLLLEIFGHLYISLITSLGYIFYCTKPQYISLLMCLSWQADNGGLMFGSLMGRRPFAHGISPKKT
jgi:CDP-diglyceride synthetase